MEGDPAHDRGWNKVISKVPSNPNQSVIPGSLSAVGSWSRHIPGSRQMVNPFYQMT